MPISTRAASSRTDDPRAARRHPVRPTDRILPKIDVAAFDPTGAWLEQLAPTTTTESQTSKAGGELRDLSDRAAVQVGALRQTLEVAVRLERAMGSRSSHLANQVDQAAKISAQLDHRTQTVSEMGAVLDRATTLLSSLEAVMANRHAAQATNERWMQDRLTEQREAFAARLAELDAKAAAYGAEFERRAAATSARVSLLLDDAGQKLADLEANATRVGAAARDRIERACEAAAAVIGHDPRSADTNKPASGSLADLVARSEVACTNTDESILRLSAMSELAAQAEARLGKSITEAQRYGDEQSLASLRDDLESVAASVRYNLSKAQQAEATLAGVVQQSAMCVTGLDQAMDQAMDQATDQAAGLVQVARDVAGLIVQAERTRDTLADRIERANPAARAQPKRVVLGAPRPRIDDVGDATVAA